MVNTSELQGAQQKSLCPTQLNEFTASLMTSITVESQPFTRPPKLFYTKAARVCKSPN